VLLGFAAAFSAATCAANGVLLREPLKLLAPALDQATTLPWTSVTVTMCLLKVDWTVAMPAATFFLTFFCRLSDLPWNSSPKTQPRRR